MKDSFSEGLIGIGKHDKYLDHADIFVEIVGVIGMRVKASHAVSLAALVQIDGSSHHFYIFRFIVCI